ncbi:MAG: DUF4838 domain-containing protein [Kiritimatiellia bacterium]|nr:DUF4838 domain-containing protein [Lentisphaerota bacterium]
MKTGFKQHCGWVFCWLLAMGAASGAQLVQDGAARAQIVIAENPPRMVSLAAQELQEHLNKISGAELPIVHEPSADLPVKVYVGRSRFTDELGITDEGLKYGAFRMVAGADWLVLLGRDFDFVPPESVPANRRDDARALAEWDRLTADRTDTAWGNPMGSIWRSFNEPMQIWAHDEGGSLNAVYEFLRMLGVRWYMPGELGAVMPQMTSITLPMLDVTVRPDHALRQFTGPAYMNAPRDAVLWGRRLRLNYGYELLGVGQKTHGLSNVHARREMQEAHPEYYAMMGDGRRDTTSRGTGHVCFSSEGLQREAANYVRAVFDIYNEPTIQLSPQDGLRMCQCEKCRELTVSDAVWGFLDRVAREVYKTHPDRLIIGAAYTGYREPPASIDQLSPNLALRINNVGRPTLDVPERWEWYSNLIESWRTKVSSGKIVRVENNYYNAVIHPRMMARDLQYMQGLSLGEMNEVSRMQVTEGRGQTWGSPGLNHLNLYVNAAYLWDAGQDLDALLAEYYDLFYGPAAEAMRTAFEFAEAGYTREGRAQMELPERIRFLELLHAARDQAGDGMHAQRIQCVIDELDDLDKLRDMQEVNSKRADALQYSCWNLDNGKWDAAWKEAVVDGRLEEGFWRQRGKLQMPDGVGKLKHATSISLLPGRGFLCVGIVCRESSGQPLNVSTTENNDPRIIEGDHVELLLETDAHAFYRIVVNPAGAVWDMDMSEDGVGAVWTSNTEVAVAIGDDHWTVEMHIPLVPEDEGAGDPNHFVLYRRIPSQLWPWHFNLSRVRVRDGEVELSVFAPLTNGDFHDRVNFGRLVR